MNRLMNVVLTAHLLLPLMLEPARADESSGAADRLLIVHCLLPGQVRQLGSRTTYVSPRRGARITAEECEIRGGEYVREDSANAARALSVWLPAALEGDPDAQINVGLIFERGYGRSPDLEEAARWYEQAAQAGSARAQLKLSELYETGRGVPVDLEQAVFWYQQAMGGSIETTVVVDTLSRRNAELLSEVSAIEAALNRLEEENATLLATMKASLQQAEQLVDGSTEQAAEIQQLSAALSARRAEITTLREELDASRAALARAEHRAEEAADGRSELEESLAAATSVLTANQLELASRAQAIEDLERSLDDVRQALALEQATVAELNARVQNVEASTRGTKLLAEQAQENEVFSPPTLTLIDPKPAVTRGLVKVSAPAPGSQARLVGRVQAAAGLFSLTVDGVPVEPNPAGLFMRDLGGMAGRSINIVAVDQAGQIAQMSFDYTSAARVPVAQSLLTDLESLPFGRYKALIIGNNRYTGLPALQSAEADAVAVAEVLRARYGFDVTLLRNATRFQILSALNELRETLTSEDNLIIYYAGHGELDRVNMRGYWLPVDADRNNTANWISNVSITDILNAMSAKHVLLLADSCYSGALTRSAITSLAAGRTAAEEVNWVRTMLGKRSRQALTSGGLQPVLDSGGGTHSVFAGALISVLEANDQVLEGRDLYEAVAARVAFRSASLHFEQVPEFAPIRHAGHEAGAFFLRPL